MRPSNTITLLTDFGDEDGFVGIMKGVILNINPKAKIVDISHQIPRHNIEAGAFILNNAYRFFPAGTINMVIVDPGVGGTRRPIAVKTKKYYFIAPDNQILKYIFHRKKKFKVYHLSNQKYFLKKISHTFHGRDIFAPCAAHLSLGTKIQDLGSQITDFDPGIIINPTVSQEHIEGQIIYSDKFGNLISNIPESLIQDKSIQISVGKKIINNLSHSYAEAEKNEPIALIGSSGYLEIALYLSSARNMLNLSEGDKIRINLLDGDN